MACPTAAPVGRSGVTIACLCPSPPSRTGSRRREKKGEGHIDTDLFRLFIESGAYRRYAEAHLKPEQLDEVNERELLDA